VRILRVGETQAGRVIAATALFDRRPTIRATRAYLSDRRNVMFLAYQGERAVGFLRGTALNRLDSERPQMFLYEVGVAPRFRRRGIARALIEQLLALCRDQGFQEVFVLTSASNRPAVRLYRKTGARAEGTGGLLFVYDLLAARPAGPVRARRRGPRSRKSPALQSARG